MMLRPLLFAIGFATTSLPMTAVAATGLDDTFGDFGVALFPNAANDARTVAHLPRADGGSVAVISFLDPACPGGRRCLGLVRFAQNGAELGLSIVPISINFTNVGSAAIDAQGRIVVVGTIQITGADHDFLVTRLFDDASPDTSFGVNARSSIAFDEGGGLYDAAHAVDIDAAGRIVVVGEAERSTAMNSDFAIVRLLSNGERDLGFGGNGSGRRLVPFDLTETNRTDVATAVAIDGGGRILVGGTVRDGDRGLLRMGLARLTDAGDYDSSWCPAACNYNDYAGIHSGRRTIYFGVATEDRTHTLTHLAVNNAGAAITVGRMRFAGAFTGFAQRFIADGTWTAELELDGGESATGNSVTPGAVHWLEPGARSSDVIITGVSGVGEDLFFAQRMSQGLVPTANWGSNGVNNSVFAFSATGGFTGDPGVNLAALSSIDRRGRVLMAGAVKAPLSSSPYNAMVARLTNSMDVFFDGFEGPAN